MRADLLVRSLAIFLGVGVLSVVGCSSDSGSTTGSMPRLKPVSGTITMDGKPLEGAVLTFLPVDEKGSMCVGETDEAGKYKLSFVGMPGCAPGDYQVMMSYKTGTDGNVVTLGMQSALVLPKVAFNAVERMPKDYAPGTTVLKAKVPEEGGVIDFDLKGPLLEAVKPALPAGAEPKAEPEPAPVDEKKPSTEEKKAPAQS